mmetsp:Transcript_78521/g.138332  ORF Transcript_78521/g.138332 Transcript_78521/m.138332 type:complete len:204 (-) Transcript_78521:1366-1977(-)
MSQQDSMCDGEDCRVNLLWNKLSGSKIFINLWSFLFDGCVPLSNLPHDHGHEDRLNEEGQALEVRFFWRSCRIVTSRIDELYSLFDITPGLIFVIISLLLFCSLLHLTMNQFFPCTESMIGTTLDEHLWHHVTRQHAALILKIGLGFGFHQLAVVLPRHSKCPLYAFPFTCCTSRLVPLPFSLDGYHVLFSQRLANHLTFAPL